MEISANKYENTNYSRVEHEKSFITSGPVSFRLILPSYNLKW